MTPAVKKPLTLGFIGRGATSAKNATALLSDLIEAETGKAKIVLPATKERWTDAIEAVADFALENKYPLVLVTDDTTAEEKALKGYLSQAAEKVKVVNAVNKVVKLAAETSGKLIMLWDDEDDDCYAALELAEGENVEALDLTSGLHRLEFTGGDQGDQSEAPADDESQEDDLDDMDEAELQEVAEALGLDVESYPEWEDVRVAIREARDSGEADDGGVPTADEVLEWDFDTLKKYAQANNIEVPPRSKTFGYRKAITEFLASAADHTDALEQEEEDLTLPADDDGEVTLPDDDAPGWKEYLDGLQKDLQAVLTGIDNVGRAVTEHMIEIRTMIMEVTKAGTVQKAQQEAAKSTTPAKATPAATKTVQRPAKAPEKAAPPRKVNRPGSVPAPTDEAKERPLAPFMHLLGKKLTKAQAKEIIIASGMRGRGRPTEDERILITAARELVPQV